MKNVFIVLLLFLLGTSVHAQPWVNDAKSLFQNNQAVVLTINIRTFGANDVNKDGIIQTNKGEEQGNFVNAIKRLDELEKIGVNTIHVLPISPVGKRNAKGTAGSLFAVSDYTVVDDNLKSKNSFDDAGVEAKRFVEACHKRNIRVLVEVPAFASYDMYLKKPRLFIKNKTRNAILIKDKPDLRIFNAGTGKVINKDVYDMYEKYLDMLMSMNVDGVVVQCPYVKPLNFWKPLIDYARARNEKFVFVAEMSQYQKRLDVKQLPFVKLSKLLNIGFDAYLGGFENISNWKTSNELYKNLKSVNRLNAEFSDKKAVIADFNMYYNVSPILIDDVYLSKMIIWLSSTLPVNSLYTDGFQTGDDYSYPLANLKTKYSMTNDDKYYVERGKLDIYNFSRRPEGIYKELLDDFKKGNEFKSYMTSYLTHAKYVPLKTEYPETFAYAMSDSISNQTVFVIGSFDLENIKKVEIKLSGLNKKLSVDVIKGYVDPEISRGKLSTIMAPADIQVFLVKGYSIK